MKKFSENKAKWVGTSLVTLLPMIPFWFQAREAFFYPLVMLVGQWLCLLLVFRDRKNQQQSKKVLGLVAWILPVTSLLVGTVVILVKQGGGAGILIALMNFSMGLMLFFVGNYLPKVRQNSTVGIRVRWTLKNEANWNASHRFGGKVWVICGLVSMASALLGESLLAVLVLCLALLVAAVAPCLYSYLYYRRQLREGQMEKLPPVRPWTIAVTALVILGFAGYLGWSLFSGSVTMVYGDTALTVDASGWQDLTVPYQEITSLNYYSQDPSRNVDGTRTYGMGNLKMSMGSFENQMYGAYTRYTYHNCDACVVLEVNGQTVVLNGPDETSTQEIYQTLQEKTGLTS